MIGSRTSVAMAILLSVATVTLLLRLMGGVRFEPGGLTVIESVSDSARDSDPEDRADRADARPHAESPSEDRGAPEALRPLRVEALPCFECHSLDRFMKGSESEDKRADAGDDEGGGAGEGREGEGDGAAFPHQTHREDEGLKHCHLCHAFKGHFTVVTRKALCEECH